MKKETTKPIEVKPETHVAIKRAFFREEKVVPVKTLITIHGETVANEGGIVTIGGLPKARKSTFMFGLIASILTGRECFNFSSVAGDILLVDTEQTGADFNRHLDTLRHLTGKKKLPKQFNAFLFRQDSHETIIDAIPYLLEKLKPQYLFLDSVTDMVYNVNDFEETKKFVNFLKNISAQYNVTIVTLVHLGKTNGFTLGALGAQLDRVSQTTLIVKKEKETGNSTIEPLYMRSADEFKPFAIHYNKEDNKYELADVVPEKKVRFSMANFTEEQTRGNCDIIFDVEKTLTYKALVEKCKAFFGCGETYARSIVIPYCVSKKYIVNKDGNYKRF